MVSGIIANIPINWVAYVNDIGIEKLGQTEGKEFVPLCATTVEITLDKDAIIELPGGLQVTANVPRFVSEDPNDTRFATRSITSINLTGIYNYVTQNEGETYDAFKDRLQEYDYGLYLNEDGSKIAVAKLPEINENGRKYSEFIGDRSIGEYLQRRYPDLVSDTTKAKYERVLGPENVIGGAIPKLDFRAYAKYPNYSVPEVEKTSVVTFTCEGGEPVVLETKRNAISTVSDIKPLNNELIVQNYDADTMAVIVGSVFDVIYLETGEVVHTLTTNDEGIFSVKGLKDGKYKIVQVSVENPYSVDSVDYIDGAEFEISSQSKEGAFKKVTNRVPQAGADVTAQYVDEEGNEIDTSEVYSGNIGEEYTTTQKEIAGYEFVEVKGAPATGVFKEEAQTVTYVYRKIEEPKEPENPEKPTEPSKPQENGEPSTPGTGISSNTGILAIIICTGVLTLLIASRKKTRIRINN